MMQVATLSDLTPNPNTRVLILQVSTGCRPFKLDLLKTSLEKQQPSLNFVVNKELVHLVKVENGQEVDVNVDKNTSTNGSLFITPLSQT